MTQPVYVSKNIVASIFEDMKIVSFHMHVELTEYRPSNGVWAQNKDEPRPHLESL